MNEKQTYGLEGSATGCRIGLQKNIRIKMESGAPAIQTKGCLLLVVTVS